MQKIKNALSSHSDDHATSTGSTSSTGQLPVQSGVTGRAEETGPATQVQGETPGFADKHSIGHDRSRDVSNNFDLNKAEHEHKTLAAKSHDHHHGHQVEEVERQKVHERHVHHTQLHVQPVKDEVHHETKHTQNVVPETKIHETHGSTKSDIAGFNALATKHKDETHDHGTERRVVDKGETVDEKVHHHVHNIVQPIVKTDHHHHETIHTVIPTHHVTHEAPVVHESIEHAPVSKADFLKKGGDLSSNISHHEAANLNEGGCDRQVDGVGEKLAHSLGLKSGTVADQHKGDTKI